MSDFFNLKQNYFESSNKCSLQQFFQHRPSNNLSNLSLLNNNQNSCCETNHLVNRLSAIRTDDFDDEFDPFNTGNNTFSENVDFSQSAPPQSQWLHGKINRYQAEERLKNFKQPGCYLVRKSDKKLGSFVLSYLGEMGIINHFRITAVCGDYYIGGKKFSSLNHLIGYYTSYMDLLKNERLVYPVPPTEPVKDRLRVISILPYTKMSDTEELSFCKGDIFDVHSNPVNGWLWCTNLRTNENGLVFKELVKELENTFDPNKIYPWFLNNISKQDAVDKLAKQGPGSFLVRPSDNSPGNYSLFFYANKKVQRFRIERIGDKYAMGGRYFNSLEAVINRYKQEQIVAGFKLGEPVIRDDFHNNCSMFNTSNTSSSSNLSTAITSLNNSKASNLFNNCSFPSFVSSSSNFTSNLINLPKLSVSDCDNSSACLNMQEIYATLRASREQCQITRLQQKLSSFLLKKSQKNKKWKPLFFVLNPDEQTLCFFENEKKMRPKGLIDLSYTYLYAVHESLFDKSYCFQLVEKALPCISTVYFICVPNYELYQEWIQALKPLCSSKQQQHQQQPLSILNGSKPNQLSHTNQRQYATQIRTLYLSLLKARRLPVKLAPHPFCLISLNKQKIGRTSVKCPPDPIYEEDFVLEDIPGDITYFSITLINKGKRSKDTEIAEFNIELSKLVSGKEIEDWFNLSGIMIPGKDDFGSIRLRIRYVHELIMPIYEYAALKQILMEDDLEVISLLEDFCHKDRSVLANSLLQIFVYERKETIFLKKMIEREVKKESETCTLFRMNSLTTSLMDNYMKANCSNFMNKALKESLNKIMDNKHSCELNPSRLDSLSEACANAEHLLTLLDEIIERIFNCVEHCPPNLRYIFYCLQKAVSIKWPNDQLIRTQSVSSFIFLRLICPAILNPRQFNLINEIPSEVAARSLILIAKSLQNLSNLVEFGLKEPWMEVVNPFILKNKARMIKFIDELATINELTENELKKNKPEPAREFATIHTICETHHEDILNLSQTCTTLKKLAKVSEILTKHKQRYSERIS